MVCADLLYLSCLAGSPIIRPPLQKAMKEATSRILKEATSRIRGILPGAGRVRGHHGDGDVISITRAPALAACHPVFPAKPIIPTILRHETAPLEVPSPGTRSAQTACHGILSPVAAESTRPAIALRLIPIFPLRMCAHPAVKELTFLSPGVRGSGHVSQVLGKMHEGQVGFSSGPCSVPDGWSPSWEETAARVGGRASNAPSSEVRGHRLQ
jgi:hypothetical protein